ncbi:MAG: cobalamin biosynthesis protein [Chloroflexota bacterium]|nr:cobalamin biosynthesis protein [Chloroflexota bacterium]
MDSVTEKAPRTALVAVSRDGVRLASQLASRMTGDVSLHVVDRYAELVSPGQVSRLETFPLPMRAAVARVFESCQRLVLFLPVGAAVRLVAPLIQHKRHDPAVVCIDDAGRFAVSLLSGHTGGADELAQELASVLGATAVITSASHVKNTVAVDLLGREYGWEMESDSVSITRVSAAVINGEPVGVCQEAGERGWLYLGSTASANLRSSASVAEIVSTGCSAAMLISDRESVLGEALELNAEGIPSVVYRPKSLVVGMGCRRGVSAQHLEDLLATSLEAADLSKKSVKCIATAEIKRDEAGLIELAGKYEVPLVCYGADDLNGVFARNSVNAKAAAGAEREGLPTPSAVAHGLLGVWGVSEPAALLASGAERLLVTRRKTDRATLSVARIPTE